MCLWSQGILLQLLWELWKKENPHKVLTEFDGSDTVSLSQLVGGYSRGRAPPNVTVWMKLDIRIATGSLGDAIP